MYRRLMLICLTFFCLIAAIGLYTVHYSDDTPTNFSILPLDEFIVKVSRIENNGYVYVKLNISLEFDNQHEINVAQHNMSKLRDMIYSYLYSLTEADLNKSSALYFLNEQITLRLNKVLKPIRINSVLFNDFIIG